MIFDQIISKILRAFIRNSENFEKKSCRLGPPKMNSKRFFSKISTQLSNPPSMENFEESISLLVFKRRSSEGTCGVILAYEVSLVRTFFSGTIFLILEYFVGLEIIWTTVNNCLNNIHLSSTSNLDGFRPRIEDIILRLLLQQVLLPHRSRVVQAATSRMASKRSWSTI